MSLRAATAFAQGRLCRAIAVGITVGITLGLALGAFRPQAAQAQSAPVALEEIQVTGGSASRAQATSLQLNSPNQGGSRLNLTPLQTPASVEIISSQTIQERGEHNVIDAVTQNATGITAIPAPGNGGISYVSRGFGGNTSNGSVMQLVDGNRLFVGAGTVTFPFDTWSVSRIEVLRGPASVLYGEGAIGGIINIVTKQPIFSQFQGEVEGALGAYATRRIALDVGGPATDPHWAYRFSYSGNASNGYVNDGEFSNNTLHAAIGFQPHGDFNVTLTEDYGDQRPSRYFGEPLVNGQLTPELRFKNYNVADATIHYADNFTQLKAQWAAAPGISVDNEAYYFETHRHFRDVETYAFDPIANLINRSDYIEIYHTEYQYGDRAAVTFRGDPFGMKNAFVIGGEYNNIYFKRTSNTPYPGMSTERLDASNPGLFMNLTPLGTHPEFQTRTNTLSGFVEDHLDVTDRLALLVGGRYDLPTIQRTDLVSFNRLDKTFHNATYRVGALYTLVPGFVVYGQYATGVDGLGSLISLSVANADFKLSPGDQIEFGVKKEFWNGRVEFTLAGYQIVKKDLLSVDPITLQTRQVGEQSSRGIEANLSFRVTERLRGNANLAVLRAKYDDFQTTSPSGQSINYAGNIPMNTPQQVGNLGLAYALAPDWEARGQLQYIGKIYADDGNMVPLPSAAIVNAQLEWRPSRALTLTGRIYNLFDKIYATSAYSSTQGVLGIPRTFEIALNYRY